jgi:hypothetical protein
MINSTSPSNSDGTFDLTEFLAGETHAWGVFEDRFGRVRRRFRVTIQGTWSGDTFVLREDFIYDDGEVEHRVWNLRKGAGGSFTATTGGCIGEATGTSGRAEVRMRYRFNLKLKHRSIAATFDDRIYRLDERTAVNRATVRKWGVKLGEVSLFFAKAGQVSQRMAA